MLRVSQLFIYPVKSLGGIALNNALVTDRGLRYDRRWMLVDDNNRFLSQRELPQMALFKPALHKQGISVTYTPDQSSFLIPFQPQTTTLDTFTVWDDSITGQYVSPAADEWFTQKLGVNCRLAYMPDDTQRQTDLKYAQPGMITSFADAYPFLLIGQASLDDLSNRVGHAIPANRFRPNIVFTGGESFAEDELAHFSINNIHFYGVKLCVRCPVPGIDQDTAERQKEPLKTLAGFRRRLNKVYFGQNLTHVGQGTIAVGDEMEILKVKEAAVFE
ncbi:hypothetical protein C8P68_101472 [Mucilaginibacter yixingensis]|uniref:MOSC domain-containing protein n=1 Tax=Mucilaginibacter yixingensis TaxID=1295612 RepID=A0A2T5JFN1_9SPHI|nr:MOSC N-terminal beta barrel domain-containing protein [Mucilaginibacter yixingensis]PTR01238.1 hypothetical protein C8P68_101472 [Mucilaginibacter yixingensis]